MTEREVTQIMVGGQRIGIIDLKPALEEVARDFAGRPEAEIKAALMERLGRSNYIVEKARAGYEEAFYREYRKLVGDPLPGDPAGPLQIKVLGPGCPECDRLERDLMAVMAELDQPADLEHVRDIQQIACYGVMGSPALVVDGKVMAVGRVPSRTQLKQWLRAASKR
jgi:small redox-active disulfide protein 2